jgi:transcriptional regulator with XRE-family HTH domain
MQGREEPWLPSAIPHEVVGMVVKQGYSLVRAWSEYLGLTQKDLAIRMGVKQSAVAQFEEPNRKLRKATVGKLAIAMHLDPDQLRE